MKYFSSAVGSWVAEPGKFLGRRGHQVLGANLGVAFSGPLPCMLDVAKAKSIEISVCLPGL
jgi:hypothetical protein